MPMTSPRQHIALAIDGGGAKGLIVARALVDLEKALANGDSVPLIQNPRVKVLSGTSTGAVISAGIAIGMSAQAITDLYLNLSTQLFRPILPTWIPAGLRRFLTGLIGLTRPSLYPNTEFVRILRDTIDRQTGITDITLGQLGERLAPNKQSLVITTAEIGSRHTRFLKTYCSWDSDWNLWEAVYASSAAPTIFPVFQHSTEPDAYYTDGGVGSFGNPAYIAAREAVDWNKYDRADVTVYSFGTGWLNSANFVRAAGKPSGWNILDFAENAPTLITQDAIRVQSVEIIDRFVDLNDQTKGLDLRRFQPALAVDFDPYGPVDATNQQMVKVGEALGQRILNDDHPLGYLAGNPLTAGKDIPESTDPERLIEALDAFRQSRTVGGIARQT